MKVTMIPLVVGALGTPAKAPEKRLKIIGIDKNITELKNGLDTSQPEPLESYWGVKNLGDTMLQN